jgi:hypothetical protein
MKNTIIPVFCIVQLLPNLGCLYLVGGFRLPEDSLQAYELFFAGYRFGNKWVGDMSLEVLKSLDATMIYYNFRDSDKVALSPE